MLISADIAFKPTINMALNCCELMLYEFVINKYNEVKKDEKRRNSAKSTKCREVGRRQAIT